MRRWFMLDEDWYDDRKEGPWFYIGVTLLAVPIFAGFAMTLWALVGYFARLANFVFGALAPLFA